MIGRSMQPQTNSFCVTSVGQVSLEKSKGTTETILTVITWKDLKQPQLDMVPNVSNISG